MYDLKWTKFCANVSIIAKLQAVKTKVASPLDVPLSIGLGRFSASFNVHLHIIVFL